MKKEATFGAGCFWCIEACFKDIEGVEKVIPGYSGGTKETADYKTVCEGNTDHAEVARIEFDDSVVRIHHSHKFIIRSEYFSKFLLWFEFSLLM